MVFKIGTIVSITIIVVGLDFGFTWDGMEGEGCRELSMALCFCYVGNNRYVCAAEKLEVYP